ncbi:MAG: hypothetical protein AB8I58_08175, partial [Anaerolineales bacterium]
MHRSKRQMVRVSWRDTLLLLNEFRTALLIFLFAILGGGTLYYIIAERVGEPLRNFSEAIYIVLSLAFFQPPGEFVNDINRLSPRQLDHLQNHQANAASAHNDHAIGYTNFSQINRMEGNA